MDSLAPVYKIARFDGSAWHKVGDYFSAPDKGEVTALWIADHYLFAGVKKNSFDAIVLRCDLNTEEWIEYPAEYPGNSTIEGFAWNGADVFICANNGYGPGYGGEGVWRWGIPSSGITIEGVPERICKKDLPVTLPVLQNGITGTWTGWGVTDNIFNPVYSGAYNLMFRPEQDSCAEGILFRIRVSRDSISHDILPKICERNSPIDLSRYPYDISGVWSGEGVSDNVFNPSGLSGNIQLHFSPDPGQCVQDTSIMVFIQEVYTPKITGIPWTVCEADPPVCLGGIQDRIPGYWEGQGVSWNGRSYVFNPSGLTGVVQLTFHPGYLNYSDAGACGVDPGFFDFSCIGASSINIQVMDSSQCLCTTYSGTLGYEGSILNFCKGTKFAVSHNEDEYLEPDDEINFIIHDHPGNQLGIIYGVSQDGVFSHLQDIIPETTYYISAMAGSLDCNGYVSQTDPCLSVSNGIPVIFHVCDPMEENITQTALSDDSLGRKSKVVPLIQTSPAPPTSSLGSQETISFPNRLAQDEKHTDHPGETIPPIEPDAVMTHIHLYDYLGREILSRRDISPYETYDLWSSVVNDLSFSHGVLIYVIETDGSNGDRRYKVGRIVSLK